MKLKKLWRPSSNPSRMEDFTRSLEDAKDVDIPNYQALHQWSVRNSKEFWRFLWEYFSPIASGSSDPGDSRFLDYHWFPDVRLNFAENLLRYSDDHIALNFQHESGLERRLSYRDLHYEVGKMQRLLEPYVKKGDVVAAYAPNIPETVITMLAATGLGAIFTSTSCDFGVQGVLDRFQQTQPKVLFAAVRYTYNGKEFDLRDKIREIQEQLTSLEKVILVDFLSGTSLPGEQRDPHFVPCQFSDPLYIMYSSGTTGKPKCIVHGVGGTLLNHYKELALHTDVGAETKISFFTTCGWMMWNWLVSSLAMGAEVMLYEGAPKGKYLLEVADREGIQVLGLSPRYLKSLEEEISFPKFNDLKAILGTGAPLTSEQFEFVYKTIKKDVQLVSLSGGTDILGCFALGNPMLPVYRGELQCLALGMDVAAFNEQGNELIDQEGELVCRQPFPNMPVCFWNDKGNERYKKAYFDRYPGVWHHGDFVRISKQGTMRIFGRSDTTLNPSGVRIGTSEIYRQVETLDYIQDSICVGKERNGDVVVVLFVQMKIGEELTEERREEIRLRIRVNISPRHMPGEIIRVKGIPYTGSGKKQELLVSRLINGRKPDNLEVVVNPECLEEYVSERECV